MAKTEYTQGNDLGVIPVFPPPVHTTRAPTSSDINYELGQVWLRTDTAQAYILSQKASGSATWTLASPGASDVDTLTGDSGGAISPSGGNIDLSGGTNVTTVGAGNAITFNLDDAISLATSVTSPLYTAGAGVDVDIEAPSGQNVIMKLGDAAGSNKLSITDSADSEVFAVDSNGSLTFSGLTVSGNFAQTGGTFNVGQDNAANAINIGGGTSARAIAIGNGSAAHTVAIGQASAGAITVDTAAGVSIDAATASNLTVTGASENLTLSSVGGSVVMAATEDAAQAIYIHANGGTSETIQLHADQGTGVSSIYLLSDAGGLTFEATGLASDDAINLVATAGGIDMDAALQINIASSENAADAIVINSSAGGIDITAAGAAGEDLDLACTAGSVNITSGEAAADAIVIDASDAAGGIDVDCGSGGFALDVASGAISLDSALASNFTVTGAADLTLSSSAGSVNISGGEAAADAVSIQAASGGVDIDGALQVNIASSQNAADAIRINASAGGIDIDAVGASGEDINITNTGGSLVLSATESAADAITIESTAGGIDILASGAAAGEDIDVTATGSSINLTSSEAAGDAIVLNASDSAGGIDLVAGTGGVDIQSGLIHNVVNKVAGDSPYSVLGTDYVVACDTGAGAITVTLPGSPATGRTLLVVDEGGSAGANNITVSGNGNNISGAGSIAATDVIDSNYGTMLLVYNGTFWNALDVA